MACAFMISSALGSTLIENGFRMPRTTSAALCRGRGFGKYDMATPDRRMRKGDGIEMLLVILERDT